MNSTQNSVTVETPNREPIFPYLVLSCLFFAAALISGIMGIDFGEHWDEGYHFDSAWDCLSTGRFLPTQYSYPSVTFDLTLISLFGNLGIKGYEYWRADSEDFVPALKAYANKYRNELKIRTRIFFLVLSQLAALALFFLAGSISGYRVGCFAAIILSTSNEFLYHSRWIAPDTVMALWITLAMGFLLSACARENRNKLWIAALFAGLAVGTKYTSIVILLPLLAAHPLFFKDSKIKSSIKVGLRILAVAGLTFILVNPGYLVLPFKFLYGIFLERQHYGIMGHTVYTVSQGSSHMGKSLLYFATQVFSSLTWYSVLFFALAVVGMVHLTLTRGRYLLLIGLYLIPYMVIFSFQKVMIVRNWMTVIPFLAFFSAAGIFVLARLVPRKAARAGFVVFIALATVNASLQVVDARDIMLHAHQKRYALLQAKEALKKYVDQKIYLTKNSRRIFSGEGITINNEVNILDDADLVLAFPKKIPCNTPFIIREWYGTREVNYRYYNTWLQRKPILITREDALKFEEE